MSQSLSGKNWGSIYIPRIGQEVLVDFLNGDPDKPIVIGCVYNGSTMPPYPLPANASLTGFKSRSTKGGDGFNEIRFEDKKGEEQIYTHAQKNHDIRINNSRFETVGNDRHLIVKNDKFELVENDKNEEVGNDYVLKVGKDSHRLVAGKETKETSKTLSVKVEGDVSETFGKNHSLQVGKDSFMQASNICLEASSNITFMVGGSSISIEKGGITLKTSGDITLEASKDVSVKAGANGIFKAGANGTFKAGAMGEVSAGGVMTVKGVMVKIN